MSFRVEGGGRYSSLRYASFRMTWVGVDSRLRGNDGGLDVCIPLAPLRFAKGGGSSLRSE